MGFILLITQMEKNTILDSLVCHTRMILKVCVESVSDSLLFWRESKLWLGLKAFFLGRSLRNRVKLSRNCKYRFGETRRFMSAQSCFNSAVVLVSSVFDKLRSMYGSAITDGTRVGGRTLYDLNVRAFDTLLLNKPVHSHDVFNPNLIFLYPYWHPHHNGLSACLIS